MNHILFHNDVDGVISASLYANNADIMQGTNYVLHGMQTVTRGQKFTQLVSRLSGDIYVFDFQYHEGLKLWIDHHQNEQLGFDPIINYSICYDCKAQSAAALVKIYLAKILNRQLTELQDIAVYEASVIDSADYKDIKDVFEDKSPMMIMRAFFEYSFPSEMMFCRTVEILNKCDLNIGQALKVLNVDGSYVDAIKNEALKLKDRIEVFGKLSIIRQRYHNQYPRYSEYYLRNPKYGIRISEEGKTSNRLGISYNKWYHEKNNLNIGMYCAKNKLLRSGGGHYNVGGGVVLKEKLNEFLDKFSETVE